MFVLHLKLYHLASTITEAPFKKRKEVDSALLIFYYSFSFFIFALFFSFAFSWLPYLEPDLTVFILR